MRLEGLQAANDQAKIEHLESLDQQSTTPHPIITPLVGATVNSIKHLRAVRAGRQKAISDLWNKREGSTSGFLDPNAIFSYRVTRNTVEARQKKAVEEWEKHINNVAKATERRARDGNEKWNDFLAEFEACGTALR